MKKMTIACAALLAATVLGSAPVLAQDATPAAAPAADAAAKPEAAPKAKKAASSTPSSSRYKQCVKENSAVAKTYCSSHPDGCDEETKAVTSECRDEASGKKMKG